MIELYLLEQFWTVANSSSLQEAAKKLYVSQPTLTRSMQKLERQLGVALFDHKKNRLSLTETGKVAAKQAKKVLEAEQSFIDQVILFERSQKMIQIGSCSPYPARALIPVLQQCFPDKTIRSELAREEALLSGLQSSNYQLVILPKRIEGEEYACLKLGEENLYIALPEKEKLAEMKEVSFSDLQNLSILVYTDIGLWKEICQRHFKPSSLLIVESMKALNEIVEASDLPFFITDRTMELYGPIKGRKVLAISEKEAHMEYWLISLVREQKKYEGLFHLLKSDMEDQFKEKIFEEIRNLSSD